jgi:hypothetical protein
MASWRPRQPPRVEAPEWYRNYHPGSWDEPDGHEQAMIDGCSGSRCWPGAPLTARWPDWPQFLHDQHARRRWQEAKHAYRRQNPALASQEFDDLVNGEWAARRAERQAFPGGSMDP